MARVTFVTHECTLTGAPLFLLSVVRILKQHGMEVSIIAPADVPGSALFKRSGGNVLELRTQRWLYRGGNSLPGRIAYVPVRIAVNILLFLELVRLLAASRPERLVLNSIATRYAALPALLLGIPVVWHLHEYPPNRSIAQRLLRWFVHVTGSYFVFNSRYTQEWWHPDISARSLVVYDGVDADAGPETDESRETDIVFVGRATEEKGIRELLIAAGLLARSGRPLTVRLVGEPPRGRSLALLLEQTRSVGVAVEVTGVVEDPGIWIRRSKVLALPTYREGFGRVILEAMAERTAVVATSVGGVKEIIQHTVNGLLVKPGDTEALAQTLDLVLGDREMRTRLTENGYERVRRSFSRKHMEGQVLFAYGQAIWETDND